MRTAIGPLNRAFIAGTGLVLMLLVSSCSGDTTETTADEPPAVTPVPTATGDAPGQNEGSPQPFDDPSAGPDRSPDEPRIVPPLELPPVAPGTDDAAEALLRELDRFITDDQRDAGVPWPDLRNPDPIAAYRTHAQFQNWMAANNPTPSLVEAYTAPNSPERSFDLELFAERNRLDLRAGPADPPYSMRVEGVVHPAATGITDALLAQVPEGSAAVVYYDAVGPSDNFTADGAYAYRSPGWSELGPWVAILAPTDVGWQVWWDELTEPPPPGSRDQGPPQDLPDRTDV